MRWIAQLLILIGLACCKPSSAANYECSWLLEPIAFSIWSLQAGKPVSSDFDGLDGLSVASIRAEITSSKGTEPLNGYRLVPDGRGDQMLRSRMLVIQGNGHRASALLRPLSEVAKSGVEVLIFDFRGYASSELDNPSASQIIRDYQQVIAITSSGIRVPYFIYGISFGGVVALNAIRPDTRLARLVLDSVPDKVSDLGCPRSWDPIERVNATKSPTFYIFGSKDRVVPKSAQQALLRMYATHPGSKVVEAPNSIHPFTPGVSERERIALLLEALQNE